MNPVRLWGTISVVETNGMTASWSVHGHGDPTLAVVDQIAALTLHARRRGSTLTLNSACAELLELLDVAGLHDLIDVQLGG